MIDSRQTILSLGLLAACTACTAGRPGEVDAPTRTPDGREDPGAHAHDAPPAEPMTEVAGPRAFGAPLDPSLPVVALADIEAEPERFRGAVVRTSGTVVRVCQAMGCWMELAADGTRAVRVPMAGHAFFLPRDASGRAADIVGTVRIAELSAAMREHLEREGAVATGSTLAIDATSVVLR